MEGRRVARWQVALTGSIGNLHRALDLVMNEIRCVADSNQPSPRGIGQMFHIRSPHWRLRSQEECVGAVELKNRLREAQVHLLPARQLPLLRLREHPLLLVGQRYPGPS